MYYYYYYYCYTMQVTEMISRHSEKLFISRL